MYKQLIIARKDLKMSAGKLAVQVAHASMAFMMQMIRDNAHDCSISILPLYDRHNRPIYFKQPIIHVAAEKARQNNQTSILYPTGNEYYEVNKMRIDSGIYEEWIEGIFTKILCEAKSRTALLKATTIAEELGLHENEDFFLIRDCCLTELEPEEKDDNGQDCVLTAIGFKPMPEEQVKQISKKFQLYKG